MHRQTYDDAVRNAAGLDELKQRVLEGPGHADSSLRRAAFDGTNLPSDLESYVTKVREHAYKVTDEDVEALRQAGYTEDQIFEITVAAALGAGYRRFGAAQQAMA